MAARVTPHRRSAGRLAASALGCAVLAAGCSFQTRTHGHIPADEAIASLEPAKADRDRVASALGTPSTRASFGADERWYYIGKRSQRRALRAPLIHEHKVLEVRFDENGIVEKIAWIDVTKTPKFALVDRETPTKGNEVTFMEQLVGNIGRFGPGPAAPSGGL